MKDRAHDESMAELFREDPAFARQYLNDVLDEGDQADLLVALRQIAQAFGGVPAIAEKANLNVTQLYRTVRRGRSRTTQPDGRAQSHGHAPLSAAHTSGLNLEERAKLDFESEGRKGPGSNGTYFSS